MSDVNLSDVPAALFARPLKNRRMGSHDTEELAARLIDGILFYTTDCTPNFGAQHTEHVSLKKELRRLYLD